MWGQALLRRQQQPLCSCPLTWGGAEKRVTVSFPREHNLESQVPGTGLEVGPRTSGRVGCRFRSIVLWSQSFLASVSWRQSSALKPSVFCWQGCAPGSPRSTSSLSS